MEQNQTAAPVRAKRKYIRRKPLPPQSASLSEMEPTEVDKDHSSIPKGQVTVKNMYFIDLLDQNF